MAFDLVTSHVDVDADGVGALLALRLLEGPVAIGLPGGLDATARRAWEENADALPALLSRAEIEQRLAEEGGGRLLVADAARADRLGWLIEHLHRFSEIRCWDTHPPAEGDLPRAGIQLAAAATSALVLELAERGIAPSPVEAGMMLLGIHVDTGHFTFPGTTAADHAAAARCLGWGADPDWPGRYAPRGFTAHQLRLLQAMAKKVQRLEIAGLGFALVELETSDYEPDLAVLLDQLRVAEGWPAAFLVTSWGGRVQVIGRSDGQVDVGRVCQELGGGGHREAAAATLEGLGLAEVRALVVTAARRLLSGARTVGELAIRDFVSLDAEGTIAEAADLLHKNRINALPLTRGQGEGRRVVGQVNRMDVEAALRHGLGQHPAESISARRPGLLRPGASLVEAQRHFADNGGRLLVLGEPDGPPWGLVTRTGVLRELVGAVDPPRYAKPPHPEVVRGLLRRSLGDAWAWVEQVGAIGAELRLDVHLVGGAVRDLLLERPVRDADLVVEGDARRLARALAERLGGLVHEHAAFGTAKWETPAGIAIDLASARAEFYAGRAHLPTVLHAGLRRDLGRRDFTINAMAVALSPGELGQITDPHGGLADLKAGLLRVLHGLSFHDDPTRAFRAARFAARFGFRLAEDTAGLLRTALRAGALEQLGIERLGAELERLLGERAVVEALRCLGEWKLLPAIHPRLVLDELQLDRVRRVEGAVHEMIGLRGGEPSPTQPDALWILLAASIPVEDRPRLARMVPGNKARQDAFLHGPERVDRALGGLSRVERRSAQARLLLRLQDAERVVLLGLAETEDQKAAVRWWESEGRHLRPAIDGHRLKAHGIPMGPAVGRALEAARDAAWDGLDEQAQLQRALAEVSRSVEGG